MGEFRVSISMSQMFTEAWKSSSESSLATAGISMNERFSGPRRVPGPGKLASGALIKKKESPSWARAQG